MEEVSTKKKPNTLATVAENEPPLDSGVRSVGQVEHDSDVESNSGSIVEKDAASASGSTTSEDLLYLDESVPAPTRRALDSVAASSPFGTGRSAKLPPRVPTSTTTTSTATALPLPATDAEVEGVLPSQPSIVRRMQETNKYDVDPKDARNLLPGVLLNSGSLDLDGVLDGMEARVTEKKRQQEALLNLLRQNELESLYLAQQQQQQQQQRQQQELLLAASGLELLTSALNEQCRVSPPGFAPSQFPQQRQQQAQPQQSPHQQQTQQEMTRHPLLLQQMLGRPRHGRSVSDPTFAFAGALPSMPPPPLASFHHPTPSVDPVTTLPLVDQSDALAFLRTQNLQQQPDWSTPDVTMQPSLGGNGLLSMPAPNPVPPEMPNVENSPQHRRRRHGPSKSVDFNVLTKQNKNKNNNPAKERHAPLSPSTGNKATTRAEVKKMVEYQASLGRPTYAPWFRDRSSRNNSNTPRDGEVPADKPPAHHRTQSLPHVPTSLTANTNTSTTTTAMPGSPDKTKDSQQPTPKSGRVGTGVFFPRMPVPN